MWHPCGSWVDGARGRWGVASWPPPKPNRSLWPQAQEATLGAGTRLVQGARVETGQKLDLLERVAELGALENLVGSGDAGGVLMAIEGPPGIGKTALMAETKSRGNEAGMRVLSARGSELERAFSFGVVRQLFEPLLASLSEEERADALAGAAALAEPLCNPERFNPATVIRPAPLSLEATMGFVREALSPSADDAFCAACHEETGGNPLLLRELVHAIAIEGVVPTEANVPHLRELEARAGSRAVSLRLAWLPPEATALAKAVAVLGDDADPRQAAELASLDEHEASEAVAALARVDVLRPQQPLGFVHPLIRAAVYDSL